jgi:hypothetical protein
VIKVPPKLSGQEKNWYHQKIHISVMDQDNQLKPCSVSRGGRMRRYLGSCGGAVVLHRERVACDQSAAKIFKPRKNRYHQKIHISVMDEDEHFKPCSVSRGGRMRRYLGSCGGLVVLHRECVACDQSAARQEKIGTTKKFISR